MNYVAEYEYNDQGQIVRENFKTASEQGYFDWYYDGNGNLVRVETDPEHQFVITYAYDTYGNIISEYRTVGFGTSNTYNYVYDGERIVQETFSSNYADSYVDTFKYDEEGNLIGADRVYPNSPNKTGKTIIGYSDYVFYTE